MRNIIKVQLEDFDLATEYQLLTGNNSQDGAVVSFVGLVRDYNQGNSVKGLCLEHYPEMTEKALSNIVNKARERWPLGRINIIHRIGELALSEQIVFVGVTSKHRESAFSAAQFIMDFLKNEAPFWKKETTESGDRWVEAEAKDKKAQSKWLL